MNIRNIIVTVVVILIIGGASAYLFMNKAGQEPAITDETTPSTEPASTTQKTSLKSFMAMAGTQKCEFKDTESGSEGEVYLSSGKMRGDFSSETNGTVTNSHMINDGTDIYIWMDDQQTGFKTSLSTIEKMSQEEGVTGVKQTVDINKEVDYKCESWNPDPVKFEVPADKNFNDMNKMLENAGNMMKDSPAASVIESGAACKACESLEGDAKDQCKRALKCS